MSSFHRRGCEEITDVIVLTYGRKCCYGQLWGGRGGVHCFLVLLVSKVMYTPYDKKKMFARTRGWWSRKGEGQMTVFLYYSRENNSLRDPVFHSLSKLALLCIFM